MLSQKEYEDIKWKLDNIPSSITGKQRQQLRQTFKKKLKEHKYASTYEPFTPLAYKLFFINRATDEQTLNRLIETVNNHDKFTLDTESTCIPKKPNEPALIQLQILRPNSTSYVIFIEVRHLPASTTNTFKLIQKFFDVLFCSTKKIYIWGCTDELTTFTKFNLFDIDQIYLSNSINLQGEFKRHWQTCHPHTPSPLLNNYLTCECEECINIQPSNPWGLQDSVAFMLNRWLDKRLTISTFAIGLDPKLKRLNGKELEHRQFLMRYAADDCLSMEQIMLNMGLLNEQQHSSYPSTHSSSSSSTNKRTTDESTSTQNNKTNKRKTNEISNEDIKLNKRKKNDELPTEELKLINKPEKKPTLTEEERKKIHNRSCTVKQRKRIFRYEIKFTNIDKRFSIKKIKKILREKNVSFSGVNDPVSKTTNERLLYVGIKDPTKLKEYRRITKNLFTTSHFNRITNEARQARSIYRRQ
jgi:hypothetical protein